MASVTKEFTTYSGYDAIVKIRTPKYWDVFEQITPSYNGQIFNYNAEKWQEMNNATYTVNSSFADTINTDDVELPYKFEYNNLLSVNNYCLMPNIGEQYKANTKIYGFNYSIYGNPSVNTLTGIVNNITTSDYLYISSSQYQKESTTICKFILDSISTQETCIFDSPNYGGPYIPANSLYLMFYNFTSYTGETATTIEAGKWYWVKMQRTLTNRIVSISTNGVDYSEVLNVSDTNSYDLQELKWGYNGGNGALRTGRIDLSGCSITDNSGTVIWTPASDSISEIGQGILDASYSDYGLEKELNVFAKGSTEILLSDKSAVDGYSLIGTYTIPQHDLWTYGQQKSYVNYNKVGSPTVNTTTGIAGGTSANDYFQIPLSFTESMDTADFIFRLQLVSADYQAFGGDTTNKTVQLFKAGTTQFGFASGGNNYLFYTFSAGDWYWAWGRYENGAYRVYIMPDDGSYKSISELPALSDSAWTTTTDSGAIPFESGHTLNIGVSPTIDTQTWQIWQGDFDFSNAEIRVNNNTIWTAEEKIPSWTKK